MEALIKRLRDLHKDNPHPTQMQQQKQERELALEIEKAFAGKTFSVHEAIPSELIWAKQKLSR